MASHTECLNTKALGANAHAEGQSTSAGGNGSHTEGNFSLSQVIPINNGH